MPNINAFRPVVHKKIFEVLSKFSLFCPLLGPKRSQPHYLNKSESPSPKHISYQLWLKLVYWLLRRSRLKEKVDAGRTTDDRRSRHGISSHGLRPGELKIILGISDNLPRHCALVIGAW